MIEFLGFRRCRLRSSTRENLSLNVAGVLLVPRPPSTRSPWLPDAQQADGDPPAWAIAPPPKKNTHTHT